MQPVERILQAFENISAIPRGTFNEAGIRAWLVDWAAKRNLRTQTDETGNLVLYLPATAGYENAAPVILQGHLDMVCQKTPDSPHDFTRDPIRLVFDGDWLKADQTTLGADNGISIAIMMALTEDPAVEHPALECLLTIEEEQGGRGADFLDPQLLSSRTLINLDSEDEGVLIVGCAGSVTNFVDLPLTWQPLGTEQVFDININGLQGGHSGAEIHEPRANANKLLARLLDLVQQEVPLRLINLKGGSARNAIPRDAAAVVACAADQAQTCKAAFDRAAAILKREYAIHEKAMRLTLTETAGKPSAAVTAADSQRAIWLLLAVPNGVFRMSDEIQGFVETSNNIGIVELDQQGLHIVSNHRSAVRSRLEEIARRVEIIGRLAGAQVTFNKFFNPWEPNFESPLLEVCKHVYEAEFGQPAKIELIHAGLECGTISERCGGFDTISMGPTLRAPHSPDERLYLPSLARVWTYLTAVLKALK